MLTGGFFVYQCLVLFTLATLGNPGDQQKHAGGNYNEMT